MKTKHSILALLMLVSTQIFGQIIKNRSFKDVPYANTIYTQKFIVLDINFDKQLVAFKHIFELNVIYDETGEILKKPCNCHYTGMKNSLAGVVLGVYDLKNQQYLKTFMIYNPTYDKTQCYDYKKSKQKLDSAKLFFKQNGLDITKKPKPLPFVSKQLTVDGVKFTYTNQKNTDSMVTVSKLFATSNKQTEIYRANQQDSYIMASGGNTEYLAAYKQGNKILFLSVFNYISYTAGETDQETYQFTPVFNLSKIENTSSEKQKTLLKIIAQIPEKHVDFVISGKELNEIAEKSTVSIETTDLKSFLDDNWFESKSDFKVLFNVKISDNTNLLFFCATIFLSEAYTPKNYWFVIVDKKGDIQDCSSAIYDFDETNGYIPDSIKVIKKDNQIIYSEIIASDIGSCLDTSNMNLSQAEIYDLFFYSKSHEIINNKIEKKPEQYSYQISKTNYSGTIGNSNVDVEFNFNKKGYYSSGKIIFNNDSNYTFQAEEPPEMCFSSYANIYSSEGKLIGDMSFLEKNGKIYGQLHFNDMPESLPIKLK